MIKMVNLQYQHRLIEKEVKQKLDQLFEKGNYILGDFVAEFERNFAEFCGAKYCVGVGSGTAALEIALRILGVGPGDEVIVPVNTFYATASAVAVLGATPVFVDCNQFYLLDHTKIKEKITPKTKGVIAVHLYGQMCDTKEIKKICDQNNLFLLEDAAQAHGATREGNKVGHYSTAACYSFFPGKNLGAYGDAGAITTNDDEFARLARGHRYFGCYKRYYHDFVATNSKIDAIQCIFLNEKLKHLKEWNEDRVYAAGQYFKLLGKHSGRYIEFPLFHRDNSHVYHMYVIKINNRDKVIERFKDKIEFGVHYPLPLHLQECFKHLGYKEGDFPVCESSYKNILSLPIHPGINNMEQEEVANAIEECIKDGTCANFF